jgi:molecular chaperone DnaJ
MADYYELLGVPRTASPDEMKKAYRKRARELHPDANPGDAAAEEQFKQVAKAYEVLSDPEQRARYDRFGEQGVGGAGGPNVGDMFGGGGLGDLFDAFFGGGGGWRPLRRPGGGRGPAGPPRGQDLEVVADVSFEQAVFGATVPVTVRTAVRCDDCRGTGAGGAPSRSPAAECNGRGQVQRVRQSLLGQMVTTSACPRCGGLGQVIATPCATCGGEGRSGHREDLPGRRPGRRRHRLDAAAHRPWCRRAPRRRRRRPVRPHPRGAARAVPTRTRRPGHRPAGLHRAGIARGQVPPAHARRRRGDPGPGGHAARREFVLRQRGVPRLQGRGRGDLRVRVVVHVPTKLTEFETELLKKLAEARGEEIHTEGGLFSRIKSAFQ